MGRMHAPGKGISSSALPYRRTPPSWLKTTPDDVVDHITKTKEISASIHLLADVLDIEISQGHIYVKNDSPAIACLRRQLRLLRLRY